MVVVNTLKGKLFITTKWILSPLTLLSAKHRYYQIIIKKTKHFDYKKKIVNHAKESTVALVPFFFISDVTPAH